MNVPLSSRDVHGSRGRGASTPGFCIIAGGRGSTPATDRKDSHSWTETGRRQLEDVHRLAGPRQLAPRGQGRGLGHRVTRRRLPAGPVPGRGRGGGQGMPVGLGAQNVYPEKEGAFTGEVSPAMLATSAAAMSSSATANAGTSCGETDAFINRKVHAALAAGLQVILCLGETLEERQGQPHRDRCSTRSLTGGLAGCDARGPGQWCWPTSRSGPSAPARTPRRSRPSRGTRSFAARIRQQFGEESARALPIQYGGSVKPGERRLLVPTARCRWRTDRRRQSQADQFLAIVRAALPA